MPAVEESLRNVVGNQETAFKKVLSETASIKSMLDRILKTQMEQALQEFTVTTTTTLRPTNSPNVVMSRNSPMSSDVSTLALKSALPPRASIPLGGDRTTAPIPVTMLADRNVVPTYKLNRGIETIPALWSMWTVGIGGAPSVEELDRQYGAGWRQTSSERQYYSMRKTLIDEIKRRAAEAGDGDFIRVVREMEASRISSHPPISIDKVIKILKTDIKAKRRGDSYKQLK